MNPNLPEGIIQFVLSEMNIWVVPSTTNEWRKKMDVYTVTVWNGSWYCNCTCYCSCFPIINPSYDLGYNNLGMRDNSIDRNFQITT